MVVWAPDMWRILLAHCSWYTLCCTLQKPNEKLPQYLKQNANAHCVFNRSSIYFVWRKKENQMKLKEEEKTYDFSSFKGFYVMSRKEHNKTIVPRTRTTRPNGSLSELSFHFDYYEIDSTNFCAQMNTKRKILNPNLALFGEIYNFTIILFFFFYLAFQFGKLHPYNFDDHLL